MDEASVQQTPPHSSLLHVSQDRRGAPGFECVSDAGPDLGSVWMRDEAREAREGGEGEGGRGCSRGVARIIFLSRPRKMWIDIFSVFFSYLLHPIFTRCILFRRYFRFWVGLRTNWVDLCLPRPTRW